MRVRFGPVGLLAIALSVGSCAGVPDAGRGSGRRIVVMAPAAAEMIDALGAADRIVGVGDYVTDPPSVAGLPRAGAYNAPNVEQVLSLEAGLLVTTASQAGAAAHRRLSSLGVEVLALDTSTHDGVFASLEQVGRALDLENEAGALAREMRGELEAIRRRASGLPPRRVLFVVGREPLYVAGPGSHIDEMIVAVGGVNVAADLPSPYERLSVEAALDRLPEVIIDTSDNRAAARGRHAGSWGQWDFLPAVRDDRVWSVDPSALVIPGIRLPEMTRLVGRLVQPEAFGEALPAELEGGARAGGP